MNVAFHRRILSRIVHDALEYAVEEPHGQAGWLVFVPHAGCLDVEVRLRWDDKLPCHP